MQFDDIEVRRIERNGETVIQLDGYHRPQPESKYTEYRRVVLVDLTTDQARRLRDRLGDILEREA